MKLFYIIIATCNRLIQFSSRKYKNKGQNFAILRSVKKMYFLSKLSNVADHRLPKQNKLI